MTSLQDILNDEVNKTRFILEGAALIDREVASKGGLSGMAIKAGFKTIKALKPGIVPELLDMLLPHFAPAVEPHFQAAQEQGDVTAYFRAHAAEVAEAMLKVTDARAAKATNRVLKRTYSSLRGQAHNHTTQAMPGVGALLATFV